ncbi:MAG TPA: hypothetical protein DDW52_10650 [Planctomycetaceae bacterium]|nr:hypothetical protein [Planctomycetaceae bacterium]
MRNEKTGSERLEGGMTESQNIEERLARIEDVLLSLKLPTREKYFYPTFDQATRDAASGENWSVGVHPLMTPEEIIRIFGRNDPLQRQLVLRPGYRPMICQRVCYDQHEIFKGRYYAGE